MTDQEQSQANLQDQVTAACKQQLGELLFGQIVLSLKVQTFERMAPELGKEVQSLREIAEKATADARHMREATEAKDSAIETLTQHGRDVDHQYQGAIKSLQAIAANAQHEAATAKASLNDMAGQRAQLDEQHQNVINALRREQDRGREKDHERQQLLDKIDDLKKALRAARRRKRP